MGRVGLLSAIAYVPKRCGMRSAKLPLFQLTAILCKSDQRILWALSVLFFSSFLKCCFCINCLINWHRVMGKHLVAQNGAQWHRLNGPIKQWSIELDFEQRAMLALFHHTFEKHSFLSHFHYLLDRNPFEIYRRSGKRAIKLV